MRTLTKKVLFTVFAAFLAVSCLFFAATAFSNKRVANADAAKFLKANFTNDGEFDIKASAWGNTLSYIDGTTVGGTGTVLQVGNGAGVNTFRLDLTPMKVTKADIVSIVVRVKAANFTLGSDEFRTSSNSGSTWRQYGKTVDLSNWYDYPLNANSLADFTENSDGTMGYNDIGIRTNTSSLIMYIDSVTVTVKDTSEMEMQTCTGVFNNATYNSLTCALLTYSGTAAWNDSDDGNLKYKITLKNSSTGDTVLYANSGSSIAHWGGQKWINVVLPGTYDTIIIAPGAHFAGVKVPSGTFNWNTSTSKWNWDGDIELVYGTPTLTVRTSGASDNGWGWNHRTDYANVVKSSDYGYTIGVFGSSFTAHSTNLAATKNTTSVSITFNGVSFYKLYQQDDGYRLDAVLGHFGFSVPTAALVGSNGYDVPTIEIRNGTPFYDQYLPAAKIVYTDGSWKFTTPVNYDLDFVSINSGFNNDTNGFFIIQFNAYDFVQAGIPTSYKGIRYNGQHIEDLLSYNVRLFQTNSVWFTYTAQASNPKLAAGYNGYSHPTIEFLEGATMVYNGNTYTFHAMKFYLDLTTNKWQTEIPDGYSNGSEVVADYAGVWGSANAYNSSTNLLLQYTTDAEWDYADKGDLASHITYSNSSTSASHSATSGDISGFEGHQWIVLNNLTGYDTIEITAGGTFGGDIIIPAGTFYLVNGRWVDTASNAANTNFTAIHGTWNNYNAGNGQSGTIVQYDENPLGDAVNYTNQAATLSRTSLMIKFNGETFFDLYSDTTNANRTKYHISYTHGQNRFYFTVPQADLEEGATLEIDAGLPFMNYYLGAVTLYYFNGYWVKEAPHAANATFLDFPSASWNNSSSNGSSCNILMFNVNPLGAAASATNLAATANRTSLMVKYNGSTFYALYATNTKYKISYEHGNGYFYFAIPETDLVDGAEFEIESGTPFMNYYLGAVTLVYNATSGKWEFPVNYNPSLVSINESYNNDANGFFIAQFDTTGWAQNGVPTSYTGITYNGNSITDLTSNIKFFQTHSVWFTYTVQASNPKLAANYNGYSHPTIAFAEGATMVYGGETYTFHAVTFYLNLSTNKWQTAVPDGYAVRSVLSYSSVNASYNNNKTIADGYSCTLIQFSGTIGSYTGTNLVSTIGANITVGGSALNGISGAVVQIGYNGDYTNSLFIKVPVSALVIDNTSKVVELTITPFVLGDVVVNATALHLVDGVWVASYSATIRTYTGQFWGCYDYTGGVLTANIGRNNVFALLNYNVGIKDGNETTVYSNYITSTNDVGNKIKVNGTTPLKDVEGAIVYLVNANILIAVPSCEYITIDEGTYFLGQLLGATTIYYTGDDWDTAEPNHTAVEFTDLQWNNFDYNAYGVTLGHESSSGIPAHGMVAMFAFDSNLTALDNRTSWANQVGEYSKVGNGIKINNIPLKDVEGAYLGYMVGTNLLYLYIPFESLTSSEVYTLTIDAGTKILHVSLPALTLYFYDRIWNTEALELLTVVYEAASFSTNIRIRDAIKVDADYLTDVLASQIDNYIVLGWTIGSTDYFYGNSVSVSVNTTVTITDIVNFYTLRGAYMRIAEDGNTGLRFESRIGNDDLAALIDAYDSVELGTYIAPKALLETYLAANSNSTFKDYFAQAQGSGTSTKYLKIVNENADGSVGIFNRATYETDGYVKYYGSIVNIYEVNYYNKFIGVGYLKLVKGGNTYIVFGTTNLAYTTRTIYDIAKTAYNDTDTDYTVSQLSTIKGFIDAVADLTYKHGELNVNPVITGREYTSPYNASHDNGYYYVARFGSTDIPKTIIINGKKVSSADFAEYFSWDTNAGSLVMNIAEANLAALFTDGISYGIGEPDHILWDNGNEKAEAAMLSNITGALGATAFRVWMGGNVATVNSSNEVSLNPTEITELNSLISGLINNGVKEIYLTGQHLQLLDYARIYVNGVGWVSHNTYYANYSSITPLYNDYACVPDPATEAEAYSKWLKLQYDYYNLLTAQIAEWQEANLSWSDVKFYFEGLNEPEGQKNIHKRGTYTSQYIYSYFTVGELAKIFTDVAYYMTLAVNANLDGTGFVTTPALMYVTSNSGLTLTPVYSDQFLAAMAEAILDNAAPTALYGGSVIENSKHPEDYFTVLNWHPYVAWTKDDHGELYYAEYKNNRAYVNGNYVANWVGWNNGMYNLFVNNFTGYTPKVVFTEFGMMDYGTHVNSYAAYKAIGINQTLAATVFSSILNTEVLDSLVFKNNCTIIGFRLCDMESIMAEQGETGLYLHGEGNCGFIEENGTIKSIMTEYYYIINGTRDTTALQTEVYKYYD
nr:hypothetical protein [Clostridia bacterium]